MGWFKRIKEGITTSTHEKKETPDGLWSKCPRCKNIVATEEHIENLFCCINCNYHSRIGSSEYFKILFDSNKFTELDVSMVSKDPLKFEDNEKYSARIRSVQNKTGLKGKDLFMPLRIALTGKNKGPELKYLLPLLSKKIILKKFGKI